MRDVDEQKHKCGWSIEACGHPPAAVLAASRGCQAWDFAGADRQLEIDAVARETLFDCRCQLDRSTGKHLSPVVVT